MFAHLKKWLNRETPQAGLPYEATMAGDSLDESFDAIRQTQMVDPSQFGGIPEPVPAAATVNLPGSPKRSSNRSSNQSPQQEAAAVGDRKTPLYCPTLRPPMAFLAVMDDGSIKDSEVHRLRGGRLVLGRDQGDLVFPAEVLMSGTHAQIECRRTNDTATHSFQWHFVDLKSRNGSFFRVQRALLRDGQEFLLGSHRFAFRLPDNENTEANSSGGNQPAMPAKDPAADLMATQLVRPAGSDSAMPRLKWRGTTGGERTYQFDRPHIVIGSDPATCALSIGTDAYLCPNHAKLHQTEKGWVLEDLTSRNGTWVRLQEAKLNQATEFQLGEQRFYFRPPQQRA